MSQKSQNNIKNKMQHCKTINLTFPKIPPYKQVGNYLKSQLEDAHASPIKDVLYSNPSHQLAVTNIIYDKKLEEYKKRKEAALEEQVKLNRQWNQLRKDEEAFQDNFKTMARVWNIEKRNRSELATKENHKLRLARTKEIEALEAQIKKVSRAKEDMDEEIKALNIYEDYLNQVCNLGQFVNPNAIVERFESLDVTKTTLEQHDQALLEELEHAEHKRIAMFHNFHFRILYLKGVLANLKSRYVTIQHRSVNWESQISAVKEAIVQQFVEISNVKKSVWNLYSLLSGRRNLKPVLAENDFLRQLVFIRHSLRLFDQFKRAEI